MLNAFGICEGAVGLLMVVWFFYIGFVIKKMVREQQETNRILRLLGSAGPGLGVGPKAS